MNKWQKLIDMTIDSADSAGDYLCKFIIQELLTNNYICDDDKFNLDLVLRESVNNAILHGNQAKVSKKVTAKVFYSKDSLKITIKDQGRGFDWRSKEMIELSESETHGRGLFIIRLYSDKYYYNANGNKLTFFKKIQRGLYE